MRAALSGDIGSTDRAGGVASSATHVGVGASVADGKGGVAASAGTDDGEETEEDWTSNGGSAAGEEGFGGRHDAAVRVVNSSAVNGPQRRLTFTLGVPHWPPNGWELSCAPKMNQ